MDLLEKCRRLSLAGVQVIQPWPISDVVVTPPDVAQSAAACGKESGRKDRAVDYTDLDRAAKGNTGWAELAREFGLMSNDGTFLLSLAVQSKSGWQNRWFEVRLHKDWDLVGVGAQQRVLGYGHGDPSFVTHAKDGRALIAADWYETCFSILAIPNPHLCAALRSVAQKWIDDTAWSAEQISVAQGWLGRTN